jgi:hypothetical protein
MNITTDEDDTDLSLVSLPNEIFAHILSFSRLRGCVSLSATCRHMRDAVACEGEAVWLRACIAKWPDLLAFRISSGRFFVLESVAQRFGKLVRTDKALHLLHSGHDTWRDVVRTREYIQFHLFFFFFLAGFLAASVA